MKYFFAFLFLFALVKVDYSQGIAGDLDLEFSFQRGTLGGENYAQGDMYFNCYVWDGVAVSWGIGAGMRDNMRYHHLHTPLGPVLGVIGFAAGLSSSETEVYPGYDSFGDPDEFGEYDQSGNHIGSQTEHQGGSLGGAFILGILGAILPEKIGVDLVLSERFKFHPYVRALGMHYASAGRGDRTSIKYNWGFGMKSFIRLPNSDTQFGFYFEHMGVNGIGNGAFLGGHLNIPLNY